jgi:hypothetical protein
MLSRWIRHVLLRRWADAETIRITGRERKHTKWCVASVETIVFAEFTSLATNLHAVGAGDVRVLALPGPVACFLAYVTPGGTVNTKEIGKQQADVDLPALQFLPTRQTAPSLIKPTALVF